MKVFIVDDSLVMQYSVTRMLSSLTGIELVGTAADGERALKTITENKADVVILDLSIPKVNGFDVLRVLKSKTVSPTVIIFSNYSSMPFRDSCKQLGAEYFFDKSTEFQQLTETVELLSRQQKEQVAH